MNNTDHLDAKSLDPDLTDGTQWHSPKALVSPEESWLQKKSVTTVMAPALCSQRFLCKCFLVRGEGLSGASWDHLPHVPRL